MIPMDTAPTRTTGQSSSGLLDAALAAAGRGWHVFPVRPNDKRPAVRDWETRATVDPDRIRRAWSAGPYNIGVACGPSGLIVVDLDTPKPGDTPPQEWALPGVVDGQDVLAVLAERAGQPFPFLTYSVRTGRGGRHLYFTASAGAVLRNTAGTRGGVGWLVDSRAAGGYVVAASSTVRIGPDGETSPTGRPAAYQVDHDTDVAPLPGWLHELYTAAAGREQPPPGRPAGELLDRLTRRTGYATAALRGEVQRVLDARRGNRNDTLCRAAFALGQLVAAGLLPADLAVDALTEAGQAIGLGGRECRDTIASGMRAGQAAPRDGAA
jgi:hypothetical protein